MVGVAPCTAELGVFVQVDITHESAIGTHRRATVDCVGIAALMHKAYAAVGSNDAETMVAEAGAPSY